MTPREQATQLYDAWLNATPAFFGMMLPGAAGPEAGEAAGVHDSVKPTLNAIRLAQQLFNQFYGAYARWLGQGGDGKALEGALDAGLANLSKFFADVGHAVHTPLASLLEVTGGGEAAADWLSAGGHVFQPLAALLPLGMGFDPRARHPHIDGAERVFSALADAFGLAPSRALHAAFRELYAADIDRRKAQVEFFLMIGRTWSKVGQQLMARLREMAERGETIDSLMALTRLWAGIADSTVHEAMQSEEGLRLSAAYVRASTQYRLHQNAVVEVVSQMFNVPTRAEMDDAYLEIHELKKRLRRLERQEASRSTPLVGRSTPAVSRPARAAGSTRAAGAARAAKKDKKP